MEYSPVLIIGLFFLALDGVVWYVNKRRTKLLDGVQEKVNADIVHMEKLINENEAILARIHQLRTQPRPSFVNDEANMAFIKQNKARFEAMSYDEFVDWLEMGDVNYIEKAIPYFERENMTREAEIMKIFVADKK